MQQIDRTAVKTGHALTAVALSLAFVTGLGQLALAVGIASLVAAVRPPLDPWKFVYRRFLIGWGLTPRLSAESAAPYRFARAMSGAMVVAGSAAVLVGSVWGWLFVLIVVALAFVAVATDWCAGCATHRLLARLS